MLIWEEVDVLTVLEAEPEVEPDGIWYKFTVCRDGIRLVITMYQYDGDVHIHLFDDESENQIFSMQLIDCSAVKRVYEKAGEYLEFAPSKCFGTTRYDGESSIPYGVRVFVNPSIHVALFG